MGRTEALRQLPRHERIVWARNRIGLSQEKLAQKVGTSRRHMIRIEKGIHVPRPDLMARIAKATKQPVELFDEDEDEDDLASAFAEIIRAGVRREMSRIRREEVLAGEVRP